MQLIALLKTNNMCISVGNGITWSKDIVNVNVNISRVVALSDHTGAIGILGTVK